LCQLLSRLQRHGGDKALMAQVNRARVDLVTTIRMETPNVAYEQALVQEVLAFADLDDSDASESEEDSPLPPPRPPLRPVGHYRRPESLRDVDEDAPSPTSVLPAAPQARIGEYTYFDKNLGQLVTARIHTEPEKAPPPILLLQPSPSPSPAPARAPEAGSESWGGYDALILEPARAAPSQPPQSLSQARAHHAAARAARAPRASRRAGQQPSLPSLLGSLVKLAAAAAVGVCVAPHAVAGARAAVRRLGQAIAPSPPLQLHAPAQHRATVVTKWQRTSRAPAASGEVRWMPHISMGRG